MLWSLRHMFRYQRWGEGQHPWQQHRFTEQIIFLAAWSRANGIFISVDLWKIRTQSKTTADDMHDTGCKRIGTQKHRSSIEWIHVVRGCRYRIWSAFVVHTCRLDLLHDNIAKQNPTSLFEFRGTKDRDRRTSWVGHLRSSAFRCMQVS